MKKILLSLLAAVGLSTTTLSTGWSSKSKSAPSDGIIVLAPKPLSIRQRQILQLSSMSPQRNTQKVIWLMPDNWITSIPRRSMPNQTAG